MYLPREKMLINADIYEPPQKGGRPPKARTKALAFSWRPSNGSDWTFRGTWDCIAESVRMTTS